MKSYGIKLGSGGRCVPFCEKRNIVGIGWKDVDPKILTTASKDKLREHVKEVCGFYEDDPYKIGGATGQLYRFGKECSIGDYIFYYDPPKKHVRICKVTSAVMFRDFDLKDEADIWHYRRVEYIGNPISILDFYGALKGSLLGPRMSFWTIGGSDEYLTSLISGIKPFSKIKKEYGDTYKKLKTLLIKRTETLDARDWELLVADFFRFRGAYVEDTKVGKNMPVVDVEAWFNHGEFGSEVWRAQVKRYQARQVAWNEIKHDYDKAGECRFCYISIFGFTQEARVEAEKEGIILLEAGDFVEFLISGGLKRRSIREKLGLD